MQIRENEVVAIVAGNCKKGVHVGLEETGREL